MRVSASRLEDLYRRFALSHGADADEAALFAQSLLEADLRAHQTQGIGLLPYMDELFEAQKSHFGRAFEVVRDGGSFAVVDGHAGSGHVISARAMDLAVEKAKASGIGIVTTRNSGDCGMVASYALRAVEQGMIGIAMSTGPLLVAPWGGKDTEFCTNPFSLAVPTSGADPIVIDMATSAYSMGKVVLAARDGLKLDGPWLTTPEGRYTDDPQEVILNAMDRESPMQGSLLPAGPKGFGMLLMVDVLAALLSGERDWIGGEAAMAQGADTRNRTAYYSQTLIAIDVNQFQDPDLFAQAAGRMVQHLTSLPAAEGFSAVRLPGGGAQTRKEAWLKDGVELRAEEWQMAMAVAERRGFADQIAD